MSIRLCKHGVFREPCAVCAEVKKAHAEERERILNMLEAQCRKENAVIQPGLAFACGVIRARGNDNDT